MNIFAELSNSLQIYEAHKVIMNTYKFAKTELHMLSEKEIGSIVNKKQLFAYQAFAEACQNIEVTDIDYLKLKKIIVYNEEKKWLFRYIIKSGLFNKDYYEFEYNEDVDGPLHISEIIKKDEKRTERLKKIKGC